MGWAGGLGPSPRTQSPPWWRDSGRHCPHSLTDCWTGNVGMGPARGKARGTAAPTHSRGRPAAGHRMALDSLTQPQAGEAWLSLHSPKEAPGRRGRARTDACGLMTHGQAAVPLGSRALAVPEPASLSEAGSGPPHRAERGEHEGVGAPHLQVQHSSPRAREPRLSPQGDRESHSAPPAPAGRARAAIPGECLVCPSATAPHPATVLTQPRSPPGHGAGIWSLPATWELSGVFKQGNHMRKIPPDYSN